MRADPADDPDRPDLHPSHNVTPAEVAARLKGETEVLVVSHEGPDGDALGCISAFRGMADKLGIRCRAYIPGESALPPEYLFLARLGGLLRGPAPDISAETTVYLLDCASLMRSRTDIYEGRAVRVNIDHHQDNPAYGELNLVDPTAPSSTAILYEVFAAGGLEIDEPIATALYVGLVTDTGRFQYSNATPTAHRLAAVLQEAGVDVNAVYRLVYENTPLPKLLLLQHALCHLQVKLGGALVVSWLDVDDFVRAGADEGHAEGIIDTLRRIDGARVAALVRAAAGRDGVTKVSLRSTDGTINVAAIAGERGGGGHVRAAGFTTDEAVPLVLEWIEQRVLTEL